MILQACIKSDRKDDKKKNHYGFLKMI